MPSSLTVQRDMLVNALYVAADTYTDDAERADIPVRIREQFLSQASEARDLATKLVEANVMQLVD